MYIKQSLINKQSKMQKRRKFYTMEKKNSERKNKT